MLTLSGILKRQALLFVVYHCANFWAAPWVSELIWMLDTTLKLPNLHGLCLHLLPVGSTWLPRTTEELFGLGCICLVPESDGGTALQTSSSLHPQPLVIPVPNLSQTPEDGKGSTLLSKKIQITYLGIFGQHTHSFQRHAFDKATRSSN